jgi:hypothetical protein
MFAKRGFANPKAVCKNQMGRWLTSLALLLMVIPPLIGGWLLKAKAADPQDCHTLAEQVGLIVQTATADDDLMQAVTAAAEAHCILVDEPPLAVKVQTPTETPPDPSVARCKRAYASYREKDGTVIKRGAKGRTPCPL